MHDITRTQLYRKNNNQRIIGYYLQLLTIFPNCWIRTSDRPIFVLTTTVRCSTPELSSVGDQSPWSHKVYTGTFFNTFTNKKYIYYVFFIYQSGS